MAAVGQESVQPFRRQWNRIGAGDAERIEALRRGSVDKGGTQSRRTFQKSRSA
jgi:hypothetical protein